MSNDDLRSVVASAIQVNLLKNGVTVSSGMVITVDADGLASTVIHVTTGGRTRHFRVTVSEEGSESGTARTRKGSEG